MRETGKTIKLILDWKVLIPKMGRTLHARRIREKEDLNKRKMRITAPLFRMAVRRHLAKLLTLRLVMVQINKQVNIKRHPKLILKMMLMLKELLLKRDVVKGEPKSFPLDGKRQA